MRSSSHSNHSCSGSFGLSDKLKLFTPDIQTHVRNISFPHNFAYALNRWSPSCMIETCRPIKNWELLVTAILSQKYNFIQRQWPGDQNSGYNTGLIPINCIQNIFAKLIGVFSFAMINIKQGIKTKTS